MEEKCPKCHIAVRPTDYFCYNCGNNLKPAPPSVLLVDQLALYTKSLLLPPFGILWAVKYLRQDSSKSKTVGIVAIVITLTSLVFGYILFNKFMENLNSQIDDQLNSFNY